jgi:hypothetical protein
VTEELHYDHTLNEYAMFPAGVGKAFYVGLVLEAACEAHPNVALVQCLEPIMFQSKIESVRFWVARGKLHNYRASALETELAITSICAMHHISYEDWEAFRVVCVEGDIQNKSDWLPWFEAYFWARRLQKEVARPKRVVRIFGCLANDFVDDLRWTRP